MVRTIYRAALQCSALLLAPAAVAATGQLETFSASETSVLAGSRVDFSAYFSVQTSLGSYGGDNPAEPDPQEGHQTWQVGWSFSESELLNSVFLDAAGQSYLVYPAVAPGAIHSAIWSFSLLFPNPGIYQIEMNGGWTSNVQQVSSTSTASRDCSNTDFDGTSQLVCSPWTSEYSELSDDFPSVGSFEPRGVEIHILAVPEPATLAVWPIGLLVILGVARHRRRQVRRA